MPRKGHQDDAGNIISASVAKVNAEVKIQIKDIKGLFSVWVFFFFLLPAPPEGSHVAQIDLKLTL